MVVFKKGMMHFDPHSLNSFVASGYLLQNQKAETAHRQDKLYFTCLHLHRRLRLKVSVGCFAVFGVSLASCKLDKSWRQ